MCIKSFVKTGYVILTVLKKSELPLLKIQPKTNKLHKIIFSFLFWKSNTKSSTKAL